MKMENILRAEQKATVPKINAAAGDSLAVDEVIMEFERAKMLVPAHIPVFAPKSLNGVCDSLCRSDSAGAMPAVLGFLPAALPLVAQLLLPERGLINGA
jgi:hypothetical protein